MGKTINCNGWESGFFSLLDNILDSFSNSNRLMLNTKLTATLLQKYKKQGISDTEIGRMHGVSPSKVWTLRKQYGVKGFRDHDKTKLSSDMQTALLNDFRQGFFYDDLCGKYHIKKQKLVNFIKRNCSPSDQSIRLKSTNNREKAVLIRLQKIHKIDPAIAKILGVSTQRVHQIRVKHGIPPLQPDR